MKENAFEKWFRTDEKIAAKLNNFAAHFRNNPGYDSSDDLTEEDLIYPPGIKVEEYPVHDHYSPDLEFSILTGPLQFRARTTTANRKVTLSFQYNDTLPFSEDTISELATVELPQVLYYMDGNTLQTETEVEIAGKRLHYLTSNDSGKKMFSELFTENNPMSRIKVTVSDKEQRNYLFSFFLENKRYHKNSECGLILPTDYYWQEDAAVWAIDHHKESNDTTRSQADASKLAETISIIADRFNSGSY